VTRNGDEQSSIAETLEDPCLKDHPPLVVDRPELSASSPCPSLPELTTGRRSRSISSSLVIALDLESVLVPEIWETVSRTTGVERLGLTTRDTPEFGTLMRERMRLCREHGLSLARLREVVGNMQPLPGAVEFLSWVQERMLAVIVSDTYHELAGPLVEKLGCPLMVCNGLTLDEEGYIAGHRAHHVRGKAGVVEHFQRLAFQVIAVGDSHNDLPMLKAANAGILFRPCSGLVKSVKGLPLVWSLEELQSELKKCLTGIPLLTADLA
jgi:phosphoserine / homoserine phosphotransferase